ncbi:carbohydrate ABC transporter permease [Burkholderia sp. MR1-5-21]
MRAPRQLPIVIVTFAVAILMCFPIFWTIFTGFKSETDAIAVPPSFFVPLTIEHYAEVLHGDYLHFFLNTVIVVVASTLAAFVLGVPAAYKLAFFPGKKANDILSFAISTRFMPAVAVIVPIFLLYTRLGMIDSLVGLVIIYTAFNIPLVLWLMRSFFRDVPYELIEAALMENTPHRVILTELVLPLARGGIATTAFLLFILTWNEFFFAVNLTGRNAATLPVFMASFLSTEGQSWARMSAAAILAVLPVLAVGWLASRSLVKGLVTGAVK